MELGPDIFSKQAVDKVGHQDSTESNLVKKLALDEGGYPLFNFIRAEHQRADLGVSLSAGWLCTQYPGFPNWLGYRKVKYQRDALGAFRRGFTKTACFRAWEELTSEIPTTDDRRAACVFGWPRVGYCVIRTVRSIPDMTADGLYIIKNFRKQIFLVEPLVQYRASIRKGWSVV